MVQQQAFEDDPVDALVVHLGEFTEQLARLRSICPTSSRNLKQDREVQDLVAFRLFLCLQLCLLISHRLLNQGKLLTLKKTSAHFSSLAELGVLEGSTAKRLREIAPIRHQILHAYAKLDVNRLYIAATDGLQDLENFQQQVAAWLENRLQESP